MQKFVKVSSLDYDIYSVYAFKYTQPYTGILSSANKHIHEKYFIEIVRKRVVWSLLSFDANTNE